jgi:hypothetical protein
MSGVPPKADIDQGHWDVRFVPLADIGRGKRPCYRRAAEQRDELAPLQFDRIASDTGYRMGEASIAALSALA